MWISTFGKNGRWGGGFRSLAEEYLHGSTTSQCAGPRPIRETHRAPPLRRDARCGKPNALWGRSATTGITPSRKDRGMGRSCLGFERKRAQWVAEMVTSDRRDPRVRRGSLSYVRENRFADWRGESRLVGWLTVAGSQVGARSECARRRRNARERFSAWDETRNRRPWVWAGWFLRRKSATCSTKRSAPPLYKNIATVIQGPS